MRRLDVSLSFRQIRPSVVFGTRKKAALREETYTWAPDLRSFDKLQEVGVSPYLGFILYLSTLLMFELIEAVRGRLILLEINLVQVDSPWLSTDFLGLFMVKLV